MPLKLNVGLSRKVGEADYGSRGASVNLELELESGLVGEPDRLNERIRQLFRLARASVDEELNGRPAAAGYREPANGQAHDSRLPPGGGSEPARNGAGAPRGATQSQVRAIYAIARRERINLPRLLESRFRTGRPEDLSLREASALIDELKGSQNPEGGHR